jgi:hypothetical protein
MGASVSLRLSSSTQNGIEPRFRGVSPEGRRFLKSEERQAMLRWPSLVERNKTQLSGSDYCWVSLRSTQPAALQGRSGGASIPLISANFPTPVYVKLILVNPAAGNISTPFSVNSLAPCVYLWDFKTDDSPVFGLKAIAPALV